MGRINGNLNLSRSLGDLKYKQVEQVSPEEQMITAEPDVTVTTVRYDDEFVFLGCDGIWDCLSNQQACDLVRSLFRDGCSLLQVENDRIMSLVLALALAPLNLP